MAVRNKIFASNETYFLTFTILGWRRIFNSEKYCQLVFKWFDYVKNTYGNKIYGYVIMPNHVHCLMKFSAKSKSPSIVVFNAKRFLAYGIVNLLKDDENQQLLDFFAQNKINSKARHKIFEDRYDSLVVQSNKFFLQKLNYIHNNPCQEKWQLAKEPGEYVYSSASNYISGAGVYPVDIVDF